VDRYQVPARLKESLRVRAKGPKHVRALAEDLSVDLDFGYRVDAIEIEDEPLFLEEVRSQIQLALQDPVLALDPLCS
jgi:hypothetical protein